MGGRATRDALEATGPALDNAAASLRANEGCNIVELALSTAVRCFLLGSDSGSMGGANGLFTPERDPILDAMGVAISDLPDDCEACTTLGDDSTTWEDEL